MKERDRERNGNERREESGNSLTVKLNVKCNKKKKNLSDSKLKRGPFSLDTSAPGEKKLEEIYLREEEKSSTRKGGDVFLHPHL